MDNIYKFLLIVVLVLVLFILNKNYKENFDWINSNNEVTKMYKTVGNKIGKYDQYNKDEIFYKNFFIIPNKWGVRNFNDDKLN
jgi:hypothetical protein